MRSLLIAFLAAIVGAVILYLEGNKDRSEFMLHVVTAIGVFSAVVMALYGERIKRRVNRISLTIEKPEQSDNFFNDADSLSGGRTKVFCHHLRVKNSMPTEPVKNCRVWLVRILDENDRCGFEEKFKFAVPRLMEWAPSEYSPDVRSFSEDQVFDFGKCFVEQGGRFELNVYKTQGGMLKSGCLVGERRQYVFRITADNYIKAEPITVELSVDRCKRTNDWPYETCARVEIKS
jgi:hypothetical protein